MSFSTLLMNSLDKTKTKLCKYWIENGKCENGDHCKYAHGKKELRPNVSLNQIAYLLEKLVNKQEKPTSPKSKPIDKTVLYKNAHGEELQTAQSSKFNKPDSTHNSVHSEDNVVQQPQQDHHIFHKTKICSYFQKGFCKNDKDCKFAHGAEELQVFPKTKLYKTELCKYYESTGKCNYEAECKFAHGKQELRCRFQGKCTKKPCQLIHDIPTQTD